MSLPRFFSSRLSLTPSTTPFSSPTTLRHAIFKPNPSRTRPRPRYQSTNPPPPPTPPSRPPPASSPSSSTTTPPPQQQLDAKSASRLERILARAQRFLPRRFHPALRNFRAAPASHVVAFLLVHEVTAIAPLFALVAAFRYYDYVPVGFVLGPWAAYAAEGGTRVLRWTRRKGWFGLDEEGGRVGEGRFEEELREEVRREEKRKNHVAKNKGDVSASGAGGGKKAGWFGIFGGSQGTVEGDGGAAAAQEVVEDTKSKTRKAAEFVKDHATWRNTETGYKVGVQLVAAYAITKMLLIPRVAFSLWVTPSVARAMIWTRRAVFKR